MAQYDRVLSGSSAFHTAESSNQLEILDQLDHFDTSVHTMRTGIRDLAIDPNTTPKSALLEFYDRFDGFGVSSDMDTFLRDLASGSDVVHLATLDDSGDLNPSTDDYRASLSSNEDRSSFDTQSRELASVEYVSSSTSKSNGLEIGHEVDIFGDAYRFELLPALFDQLSGENLSLAIATGNAVPGEISEVAFRDYQEPCLASGKVPAESRSLVQSSIQGCSHKRRYSEVGTPPSATLFLDDLTILDVLTILDHNEDDGDDAEIMDIGPVSPIGLVLLNSVTKQMDISSFEHSLLKFFNESCINFFSYDKNPTVDYVWRHEVPRLFRTSRLVRNSVLSFSALNMWPLGILNSGVNRDFDGKLANQLEGTRRIKGIDGELPVSLYERTTAYFQDSIQETSSILIQESQPEQRSPTYVSVANNLEMSLQFFVSSVLIFSFLGMHPHGLVPLVSFSTPRETDFLSMASSMHLMCMMIGGVLFYSPFRGLLYSNELSISALSVFRCKFPVVDQLRKDINEFRETTRQDPFIVKKLDEAVNQLQTSIYKCVDLDYPIPLFRYLVELDTDFITLIRQQNAFALKTLFVYSCLCLISRFQMSNEANIFLGYIEWYRRHNSSMYLSEDPVTVPDDLEADRWFFKSDAYLYYIVVVDKYLIQDKNFRLLASFDPELLYRASKGDY